MQLRELVAYVSDPDSAWPASNWGDLYWEALNSLNDADVKLYSKDERALFRQRLRFLATAFDRRPSLDTLLRISAAQSVGLVDLIVSPVESCSPRLFRLDGANLPRRRRRTHRVEVWEEMKKGVELLLQTEETLPLPTKASLFHGTRLTNFGFWQHYPELSVEYQRERERRVALQGEERGTKATQFALRVIKKRRDQGRDVQVRRDAAVIKRALKVPKALAEGAMHSALVVESGLGRIWDPDNRRHKQIKAMSQSMAVLKKEPQA